MLEEFSIANFKAFAEKQRIPLKPITLIFGQNSSGKSSILRSLAWVKTAVETGRLLVNSAGSQNEEIELGAFKDVLFKKKRDGRVQLEFLLPGQTVYENRVRFEIGMFTRESKKELVPEPAPHGEIAGWFKAKKAFLVAEEAYENERFNAPFAKDENGEVIREEDGTPVRHWELEEGADPISDESYQESVEKKWRPKLQALWEAWRHEEGKSGVREQLDIFIDRVIQPYWDWVERDDEAPVIFLFEILVEGKTLIRAEKCSGADELQVTKINRSLPETVDYLFVDPDRFPSGVPSLDSGCQQVEHSAQVLLLEDLCDDEAWDAEQLKGSYNLSFVGLRPSAVHLSPHLDDGEEKWATQEIVDAMQWLVQDCREKLDEAFSGTVFLGPLRTIPPRLLLGFDPRMETAAGSAAWARLRDDERVLEDVNHWLGPERLETGYRFESEPFAPVKDVISEFEDARPENFMGEERTFDLEKANFEEGLQRHPWEGPAPNYDEDPEDAIRYWKNQFRNSPRSLFLHDTSSDIEVTHRDVGVGISQLIPVVVLALSESDSLIAVEQPEIHLHPVLQAKMGDLFIQSAMRHGGNRFLLETHSEHMILRILRRIRETGSGELTEGAPRITPEDVCVLYVQRTEHGSQVIEVPVTKNGDFGEKWPERFFEERAEELF